MDELAALTQHEFENLRGEMATRDELRKVEANLLHAIEGLSTQLHQIAFRRSSDFERLADRVHDLGSQVTRVEAQCHGPPRTASH